MTYKEYEIYKKYLLLKVGNDIYAKKNDVYA